MNDSPGRDVRNGHRFGGHEKWAYYGASGTKTEGVASTHRSVPRPRGNVTYGVSGTARRPNRPLTEIPYVPPHARDTLLLSLIAPK